MKRFVRFLQHPLVVLSGITIVFFWGAFFKGYIPFPGDMLLAQYNPWRQTSYFGYTPGSVPHKGQYFDVVRELYPWKTLVIQEIKARQVPLWNPYNFSGTPLMANYQSQVWYPLSALYLVLPQPIAWTVLVMTQVLLGLIFMYLFSRSIGLSATAAILSAIAFNASTFATVWIEFNTVWHTILWIPLILYLFERCLKNPLPVWRPIFIFALFSSMTAGHPQDFINSFLFIAVYMGARLIVLPDKAPKEKFRIALNVGLLASTAALMAAVQLLPTIELFQTSARVTHDLEFVVKNMLIQTWQLPIAIIADFFGNPATRTYVLEDTYINKALSISTVGFFLVIVSFWTKKTYHFRFFALIAGVMLVFATNNPISRTLYQFPLPILSTGTPTRNLFIYSFCVSILAGIGFNALSSRMSIKKPLLMMVILFAAIFAAYSIAPTFLYPFTEITISAIKKSYTIALLLAVTAAGCILVSKKIPLARLGIIFLVVAELIWGFTKFNPFVPSGYVYPPNRLFEYMKKNAGINRFWGYGTAQIEANFATQYGIYSPDGTDPLNLKWYNSFIQSSRDGTIHPEFTRSTRSDAYIHPGYGENDLPQNLYRLRVLDTLGVKYILDRKENPKNEKTFPSERFTPLWEYNGWIVYENLSAAPRYFLTTRVGYYSTDDEFARQFFDPTFDPSSAILLPSSTRMPAMETQPRLYDVKLISYTPNEIHFQVATDTTQLLFLSDTYDAGWKSFVDGKQVKTLKADYALRAVLVPAGTHAVKMTYMPNSFLYGAAVSLTGLVIFCIVLLRSVSQLS